MSASPSSSSRRCMRALLLGLFAAATFAPAHAWQDSEDRGGHMRTTVLRRHDFPRHRPRGYVSCVVDVNGTAAREWVDVANDVRSCGGCVSTPLRDASASTNSHANDDTDDSPAAAAGRGADCTAIPHADPAGVACARGRCSVQSCAAPYQRSVDGTRCVADLELD